MSHHLNSFLVNILNEMQKNISLVSYSSLLAYQIFIVFLGCKLIFFQTLYSVIQRFVRAPKVSVIPVQKASVRYAKANFYCSNQESLKLITGQ
ncbi:hypothetical protein V2J09_023666 [Rumex salicifolius]